MIKKEKGITLATLIVMIIVILILATTILVNLNTGEDFKNYRKMCADIASLRDQVLIYYNKYGEAPKGELRINASSILEASEETGDFYNIDLAKLSNLTLNYGTGVGNDNIYIINENSLNVYYLHGIEYEGNIVHAEQ